MKILAVDSSAGLGVLRGVSGGEGTGRLLRQHRAYPQPDACADDKRRFENAAVDVREIDLFAVSAGPGSFTGVRIGFAAVKGMALAGTSPPIGVSPSPRWQGWFLTAG